MIDARGVDRADNRLNIYIAEQSNLLLDLRCERPIGAADDDMGLDAQPP